MGERVVEVTAEPRRTAVVGLLLLAGALAAVAATSDPAGQLLAGPAALVALALAVRDLVLRPVLQAGPDGLTVVQGVRRHTARWADVHRLRVVTDRRAPLLEVDLEERVLVLSRGRLGRSPYEVLAELEAVRVSR